MRKQKSSSLTKKLSIHKDTVRLLTSNESNRVAGGAPTLPRTEACTIPCTDTCSYVAC